MTPTTRALRLAELVALYIAAPLALALLAPPSAMLPALLGALLAALLLLSLTPGWSPIQLARGWGRIDWRLVGAFVLVAALVCGSFVWALVPGSALGLPRWNTRLWLLIMLFYPILSALPQEVVFRELFFRRYAGLFPGRASAALANAVLFGFAHLMFWNWIAIGLSALGGYVFARGYLDRGGFPMAVALHALGGAIVFTSGLGMFFYHGAVPAR